MCFYIPIAPGTLGKIGGSRDVKQPLAETPWQIEKRQECHSKGLMIKDGRSCNLANHWKVASDDIEHNTTTSSKEHTNAAIKIALR